MNISEVINRINTMKPSAYTEKDMIAWLSDLDKKIYRELLSWHHIPFCFEPKEYTEADMGRELLVKEPYADIYPLWISAQIDFNNMETNRYANSYAMFNHAYQDYADYINRTFLPKQRNFVRT